MVDLSVPALGFKAHDKQVFKVLATYDGLCNCTKIYVSSASHFIYFLISNSDCSIFVLFDRAGKR